MVESNPSENKGVLIIGSDAVLTGKVKNSRRVEVHGKIDGGITADDLIVHKGGRVDGNVRTTSAEVRGEIEGDVRVQQLITIKSTGVVTGNVRYGKLALEEGAELAATVRNVPPSLNGDFDLAVSRGRSVRITTSDISAEDADDTAENLTFSVTNPNGGHVTSANLAGKPVSQFTQADLEAGLISFVHDGGSDSRATFDVSVADDQGASSGPPRTVNVAVR